jgi:hypothetical protein
MSGMYDLHPVLLSSRSSYLHLTPEEIVEFSPIRHLDQITCPVAVVSADEDSPEFQASIECFRRSARGYGATGEPNSDLQRQPLSGTRTARQSKLGGQQDGILTDGNMKRTRWRRLAFSCELKLTTQISSKHDLEILPTLGRPRRLERAIRAARSFLLAILLGGCTSYGPLALDRDRLDYGEAVAETVKQQALLNIVRLRYGDIPAFVSIDQLVSSYQLQGNSNVMLIPNPVTGLNFPSWTAGATFTDRPTMTFSPVTGAVFESSFVRPFTPREVLILAQNGMWIDVLFRLAVQSVGKTKQRWAYRNQSYVPKHVTSRFARVFRAARRFAGVAGGRGFELPLYSPQDQG